MVEALEVVVVVVVVEVVEMVVDVSVTAGGLYGPPGGPMQTTSFARISVGLI